MSEPKFSDLVGKVLTSIEGLEKDGDEVIFTCSDGKKYQMYHEQSCCERVSIEDVIGEVSHLLNSPVLSADEVVNPPNFTPDTEPEDEGSSTWTFYRIHTARGQVVIRWFGSSNGYYSESVDFEQVEGT